MIVSSEVAKYLHDLGYNKECLKYYDTLGGIHYFVEKVANPFSPDRYKYSAPEIFDAVNWLWNKKNIKVYFKSKGDNSCCIPVVVLNGMHYEAEEAPSPESALQRALTILAKTTSESN